MIMIIEAVDVNLFCKSIQACLFKAVVYSCMQMDPHRRRENTGNAPN